MAQLQDSITAFLQHCQFERNFSPHTLKAYRLDLAHFRKYAESAGHSGDAAVISRLTIKDYVHQLGPYKPRTQRRRTAALKSYFGYLEREEMIPQSPMSNIRLNIRVGRSLPRTVGIDTMKRIFERLHAVRKKETTREKARLWALRDAAVFELMFSSGMRVSEISSLGLEAVDLHRASVMVAGKGSKERLIPICGQEVSLALREYAEMRNKVYAQSGYFFVNRFGKRLSEQSIRIALARVAKAAGVAKITPHVFRHTLATMLLEQGVDLRFIQNLLGHSSIVTTTIYVHVNQKSQREILDQRHPRRLFER